jgi:hypothetical protein
MFYTYLWLRDDGTPYYAGKGSGKRGFILNNHKVACPKDLSRVILQGWDTEEDAFEAEVFLISYYGRKDLGTGILHNRTNGGEGTSGYKASPEIRAKHSVNAKRRTYSETTRIKMRLAKLNTSPSAATREKMRQTRLGKKRPTEVGQKIRAAKLGIPRSLETIAKMTGWHHTPESRAKMKATKAATRLQRA